MGNSLCKLSLLLLDEPIWTLLKAKMLSSVGIFIQKMLYRLIAAVIFTDPPKSLFIIFCFSFSTIDMFSSTPVGLTIQTRFDFVVLRLHLICFLYHLWSCEPYNAVWDPRNALSTESLAPLQLPTYKIYL